MRESLGHTYVTIGALSQDQIEYSDEPCIHPWRGDWDPRGFNRGRFLCGGFPLGLPQCQGYEEQSKQSRDWCNADAMDGANSIWWWGWWPMAPVGSTSDHSSTRHSDAMHISHSPEQ